MDFPKIPLIVNDLRSIQRHLLKDGDETEWDVRLQLFESGEWTLRWGDASYDIDHRGYWGACVLNVMDDPSALRLLSEALLKQAKDSFFQKEHK